jgi:hypothetical protein
MVRTSPFTLRRIVAFVDGAIQKYGVESLRRVVLMVDHPELLHTSLSKGNGIRLCSTLI